MESSKIKFLVPIDFSEQSLIALEQSCNLAARYSAAITILYVHEDNRSIFSRKKSTERERKLAEEKLNNLATLYSEKKMITVRSLVFEGRVHEAIREVAKSLKVNLIVMATSGGGGLKRILGTNVYRVIQQSHCPVISIKGKEHRFGCQNIVLPLDLTKDTTQKVDHAVQLAKLFGDTKIRLISVLQTTDNEVVEKLSNQMDMVRRRVESEGIECTADIVKIIKGIDHFGMSIVEFAEKVEADLILIMTQQENNPTELFVGSNAQTIINNSNIPVMSVVPVSSKSMSIL